MAYESARDALTFELKQSAIAMQLTASSDTINVAVEEANEFADLLLEMTASLLPSGFEVQPSIDSWQKDKHGYYFAHSHIEIWIESRLIIKLRLIQSCEIGPSDATRFAQVLKRLAKMAYAERQDRIEHGKIGILGRIPPHPDVRELSLKILDNPDQHSFGSPDAAIDYLCTQYPERFETWCERYAEHPSGEVLFYLASRLLPLAFDKALNFLERAYLSPQCHYQTLENILQELMYLQKNGDSQSSQKAGLLLYKLTEAGSKQ